MAQPQTLAEYLGTPPADPTASAAEPSVSLADIAGDAKAFCTAVLNSYEFRQYIVHGLTLGSIPAAVILRVMDMAGWQKPPDRVEHTGKDGAAIVTEVRRVIVRVPPEPEEVQPSASVH